MSFIMSLSSKEKKIHIKLLGLYDEYNHINEQFEMIKNYRVAHEKPMLLSLIDLRNELRELKDKVELIYYEANDRNKFFKSGNFKRDILSPILTIKDVKNLKNEIKDHIDIHISNELHAQASVLMKI